MDSSPESQTGSPALPDKPVIASMEMIALRSSIRRPYGFSAFLAAATLPPTINTWKRVKSSQSSSVTACGVWLNVTVTRIQLYRLSRRKTLYGQQLDHGHDS